MQTKFNPYISKNVAPPAMANCNAPTIIPGKLRDRETDPRWQAFKIKLLPWIKKRERPLAARLDSHTHKPLPVPGLQPPQSSSRLPARAHWLIGKRDAQARKARLR
jgi:hypothetical protein